MPCLFIGKLRNPVRAGKNFLVFFDAAVYNIEKPNNGGITPCRIFKEYVIF
jgi:hypothetical protein